MKSVMDRLTAHRDHSDAPVYAEPDIRAIATEVIDLDDGGLLAVCLDPGYSWREIAVFRFAFGPSTQGGQVVEPAMYEHVFHGGGPADPLRELRHTFWGDPDNGGYIFYPPGALIADAFAKLKRWFDLD